MTPEERVKDVCYRAGWEIPPWIQNIILGAIRDAVAEEREACAQIVELECAQRAEEWIGNVIAEAIRARKEATQ